MKLIQKNGHAIRARDENGLDLSTQQIQQQPPFFGFVECKPTDSCDFLMFLGGTDDMVAAKFFYNKNYENGSLALWTKLSRSASAVLDIGAHTGVYSLAAAANNPDLLIFSIEPVPQNISRLHLNIAANSFAKITPIQVLVTNKSGPREFQFLNNPGYMTQGGSVEAAPKHGYSIMTISGIAVDESLKFRDREPNLIKIDTEGHEYAAIIGMEKLIKKTRPTMLIECNQEGTVQKLNTLKSLLDGYDIFVIDDASGLLTKVSKFDVYRNIVQQLVREKMNRFLVHRDGDHAKIIKEFQK